MKRSTVSKDDILEETFDDVEIDAEGLDRRASNYKNEKKISEPCVHWKCSKCGADCYSKCPWDRSTIIKLKNGNQYGLNTEYTLLRNFLSFEEIPVDRHNINTNNNDEQLKFTLKIPSSVAEGKDPSEVLKQYSKMINDVTDQDLKEIICSQHSWIPAILENKYCQFGHNH